MTNDSTSTPLSEVQIKSKQRVADHGEVFTPSWMVNDMLDLVKSESERIDSRFLEPACGSGNFLVAVLKRKLTTVERRFGSSEFEKRHHALLALMCIYGIELLPDNVIECRENLLTVFDSYLHLTGDDDLHWAAVAVLDVNVVQGDATSYLNSVGAPICFPEWGYLTKGKFSRRDFSFQSLAFRSSVSDQDTLFSEVEERKLFEPVSEFPNLSISDIAIISDSQLPGDGEQH